MIPLAIELDSAYLLDVRWRKCKHSPAIIFYVYFESGRFARLPNTFVGPQPALEALIHFAPGWLSPGVSIL